MTEKSITYIGVHYVLEYFHIFQWAFYTIILWSKLKFEIENNYNPDQLMILQVMTRWSWFLIGAEKYSKISGMKSMIIQYTMMTKNKNPQSKSGQQIKHEP